MKKFDYIELCDELEYIRYKYYALFNACVESSQDVGIYLFLEEIDEKFEKLIESIPI